MSEFMPVGTSVTSTLRVETSQKVYKKTCNICQGSLQEKHRMLAEPNTVEMPMTWDLCSSCYYAILSELVNSPVQTSMRLRIAVGIVASSKKSALTKLSVRNIYHLDWLSLFAWLFMITMCSHLLVILMIAFWTR